MCVGMRVLVKKNLSCAHGLLRTVRGKDATLDDVGIRLLLAASALKPRRLGTDAMEALVQSPQLRYPGT